ncbi:MAG: response regulator transcription factor [Tissierellia bacterium]|nr:response regulator transcription factor [Tissierellia bacterium]
MDRIFIVEDDDNIRELIVYAMRTGGYQSEGFPSAEGLYERLAIEKPRLFILDIMLDGDDGYKILEKLKKRPETKDIPVIMLTAKAAEYDKVKGLDMGSDDYITKPFGVMELLSRVKAVLRRTEGPVEEEDQPVSYQEIVMDLKKRSVEVAGKTVELTFKEYELLYFLIVNAGIVLTRDRIMNQVWGFDYQGESRTVDVHIRTLRQKLGDYGTLIKTVRNVGYKIGE